MVSNAQSEKKKSTGLGISCTRAEDFSQWYTEVITKSEMVEYYNVSGCYILRPLAFSLWESVTAFFDSEIKKLGVKPCYFPMFATEANLKREADHVEGFAPEVAWVTKSGDTDLEVPIAIRPTSEAIMYPAYAKWIRSHRDLPLRLNQWTNVVRWEFKNPTPFLRTREFLWQEGHSAFATKEEADTEVLDILDLYARVYEELFAVPVIKGRKSSKEKFPGGDMTTTVEAFIPANGRAVQGATSHSLGQNFSKMFGISFESEQATKDKSEKQFAWQNSWGLSTRSIGVLIMVHGDDKGLVLPPRVAPTQVVVVPIFVKNEEVNEKSISVVDELVGELSKRGIRATADSRTDKSSGWKYNYWELRGTPLRIEIGPNDVKRGQCVFVQRHNGVKEDVPIDLAADRVVAQMETIQASLLAKARKERDSRISIAWNWDQFCEELDKGNLILAPWSLTTESEEWVKDETKRMSEEKKGGEAEQAKVALSGAAKTLCLPLVQPPLPKGTPCFTGCGKDAVEWALWGRSY